MANETINTKTITDLIARLRGREEDLLTLSRDRKHKELAETFKGKAEAYSEACRELLEILDPITPDTITKSEHTEFLDMNFGPSTNAENRTLAKITYEETGGIYRTFVAVADPESEYTKGDSSLYVLNTEDSNRKEFVIVRRIYSIVPLSLGQEEK